MIKVLNWVHLRAYQHDVEDHSTAPHIHEGPVVAAPGHHLWREIACKVIEARVTATDM